MRFLTLLLFFLLPCPGAAAEEGKTIFLETPIGYTTDESEVKALDEKIKDTEASIEALSDLVLERRIVEEEHRNYVLQEHHRLRLLLADLKSRQSAIAEYDTAQSISQQVAGLELDVQGMFKLFWQYHTYEDRGVVRGPSGEHGRPRGEDWEYFAHRFDYLLSRPFSLENKEDAVYLLRAFLLQGRCYLNASRAYRLEEDSVKSLECHQLGARRLLRVLTLCRRAGPSADLIEGTWKDLKKRAMGSLPDEALNDWEKRQEYYEVCKRVGTWPDKLGGQQATSRMAVDLLSNYCPWGVEMLSLLCKARLANGLDLLILPSYISLLPASATTSKVAVVDLPESRVPLHIKEAAQALATRGKAPVDWQQVHAPIYTCWYVSPTVYHLRPSEILTWVFRIMTAGSGDAVDYMTRTLDELTGWVVGSMEYDPEETVNYTCVNLVGNTWAGVGGNKLIAGQVVKHVKERLGGQAKPVAALSAATMVWGAAKQVVSIAFTVEESYERHVLFDGFEPRDDDLSNALSYDGTTRIPPVLIRSQVTGFIKVPEHAYRRIINLVTYHVLDPRGIYGSMERLDLSRMNLDDTEAALRKRDVHKYTEGDQELARSLWKPFNLAPGGTPIHVRKSEIDFTPMTQQYLIKLPANDWEKLRRSDDGAEHAVKARLFGPDRDPLLEFPVTKPDVTFQLFNEEKNPDKRGAWSSTYETSCELKTNYELRLFRDDGSCNEKKITLRWISVKDRSTGKWSRQTGKIEDLSDLEPGLMRMTLEPRARSMRVTAPTFARDQNNLYGRFTEVRIDEWPARAPAGLYELDVAIKGAGAYKLRAWIPSGSSSARFCGWLPIKFGNVKMSFSLERPDGVPPCNASGVLLMNRKEKRKKRNEEIRVEVGRCEKRLNSSGNSSAIQLQLGMELSRLAMSYVDFCMYDVAKRAANESIRHLDASGRADQQNPARWQALQALAVCAFNTRDDYLMRQCLEQMASGVEATAREKKNPLAFVEAAKLWAQLVENLLVSGVPFDELLGYHDSAVACIKAAGWTEAQARNQLQFDFPNFLAVLQERKSEN